MSIEKSSSSVENICTRRLINLCPKVYEIIKSLRTSALNYIIFSYDNIVYFLFNCLLKYNDVQI